MARANVARMVAASAALLFLSTCGGGFHAVNPESNEDIEYKQNEYAVLEQPIVNIEPREMPALPPGSVDIENVMPLGPPRRVVEPEGNVTAIVPFADGTVTPADVQVYPYSRVGKLEYRFPSTRPGYGHSCTAQLIGDRGVALTAAHCVYDIDKREWANSVTFKLQYKYGSYSGAFDWECTAMVSGWPNGHYKYDYAFIKLRGIPPQGLGMTIDIRNARVDAVGYPTKYFNGEQLVHVLGGKSSSNPTHMRNDMERGSSGGAWLLENGNGTFTDAISLNSFFFKADPSTMYGPMLTAATLKVYEFVARSCKDRVIPQGEAIAAISKPELDKFDTIAASAYVDISAGADLTLEDDASCECGAKQSFRLKNSTTERRFVEIETVQTEQGSERANTTNDFSLIEPGEERTLGCQRARSTGSASCNLDQQVRLRSDRAAEGRTFSRSSQAGVSHQLALAAADNSRCLAACSPVDNQICLDLGKGAIGALAPLAEFVGVIDQGGSSSNGKLVGKADVVTKYGGDPSNTVDVCDRGDILRINENVKNEGRGCLFRTKALGGGLRTRLNMRANVRGTPTSWSPALATLSPVSAMLFTDRNIGPSLDFESSPAYNKRYAGDVYAVSIIDTERLVAGTSNGCIIGSYKK